MMACRLPEHCISATDCLATPIVCAIACTHADFPEDSLAHSHTHPLTRTRTHSQVELSESQKYNETLEEELARLKKKLGQRSVDMLLLQEQLQEAQEVADRHAEELAVTTAQLSATG